MCRRYPGGASASATSRGVAVPRCRGLAARCVACSLLILAANQVIAGPPGDDLYRDGFESPRLVQTVGTYLGLREATVREIVFDAAGNAVLVGHFGADAANDLTDTTVIGTPADASLWVAKFTPEGDPLWRTIIGGGGKDRGYGIDIDAAGDLYIGGRTSSTDFPTTSGAFNRTHHGGVPNPVHGATDGYVLKLAGDGSALVYSTLFGGVGQEGNRGGLAVDAAGAAYACGSVEGNSTDFMQNPSSGNSANFVNSRAGGFSDAYIVKFAPDAAEVEWTRFYGSSNDIAGEELVVGCTIDQAGDLRGVGNLWGSDAVTTDGSAFNGGNADMFTLTLSPDGQTLRHAGYVGSAGDDFFEHRLALTADGGMFAAGATTSANFPVIGAYRPVAGAGKNSHGVVMKFDNSGQMVFSSYVAGDGVGDETAFVEGLDASGRVYVTGRTQSDAIGATPDAFQQHNAGGEDMYLQIVSDSGELLYATFIGGSADDYGRYVAHGGASATVFMAAETDSSDLPATPGAWQPSLHPSGQGAFLAGFRTSAVGTTL